ncbi:MAG: chemotaxis protein CheW [Treponema sp.]|uniref:chemotaxis protein CheW n=1 Tax=Treponema sp. TaxID=166 RepID=UPI001B00FD48|nr:chemotaxis protein CheW [Treponema sp.]MBO6218053.1 chemotaxis protein CheW [Treponema sp.]MBQ8679579.1 chemotaxis protein CheW [Treponema sp.]
MSDYLDSTNEELLKDYFSESEMMVDNLESNILAIENDPNNHDAIDEIFRAAHTLKGNSATVEFSEIAHFAHTMEDLLDEVRSDKIKVTEDIVDTLLTALDVIKAMLEERKNGSVYGESVEEITNKIKSMIGGGGSAPAPKAAAPAVAPTPQAAPSAPAASSAASTVALSEYELAELKQGCEPGQQLWSVAVTFDESNPMNSVGGIQVFAALKACGTVLKTIPDFDALYEDEFHKDVTYFVASNNTAEQLEDTAFLDDVTLSVDAKNLDNAVASDSAPVQAAAPQPSAPVAPAPQAASPAPAAAPAAEAPKKEAAKPAAKTAPATGHAQQSTILRVDSKRVDNLMNLVSETVITKASFNQSQQQFADMLIQFQTLDSSYKEKVRRMFEQLPQYLEEIQNGVAVKDIKANITNEFGDIASIFDAFENRFKDLNSKFHSSTQNLGRITGELQEGIMKIRMVPISQVFDRFPRVVRDLQKDLGKKVNLLLEGEDTELDKTVVDDLMDPIMHCVRNSVDHGIESPEERKNAGKDETGTVLLKAANEGNSIVIDVVDDGGGINVEKVKAKAIDKGLIHPSKVLSDQEAAQLIFLPGFSTAEKITNVSGRGVGLDVVKTMIEKLNGTIQVTSEHGKGSKFSIRLPLTLAIIQGLLVRVGREVYSIPIASVIESVRVKKEEINTIDNYEVLNVRNEVISVLRLSRLFNIRTNEDGEYCFVVIVGSQDKKIGVMVDNLIGEEDVVIKPLRDQFTQSPGISGASILGDGSVSLIIDVGQLLELGVRQEIQARQESSVED